MSQDQQPSSEPTAAPFEAAPAPTIYTAAQLRAEALERAGRADMGEFLPGGRRTPEAVPDVPAEPVAPSVASAPAPVATQSGDVASELAAMRAEVAALMRKSEPEEAPAAPEPAKPAHPLEAHAKSVLGPGAQPKHVERAVKLLEQRMQWDAFQRHHEANPTQASAAELDKARRAQDAIQHEIDGLSELATLHAHLAEIRAESAKAKEPNPEQLRHERAEFLAGKIFTPEVLGAHHPNLWAAMQTAPAMRRLVQEKLLALPYDPTFYSQGDAILHALDAECAPATPPAAPAQPQASAKPAPRGPVSPAPRAPAAPPPPEQPILTKQQWRQLHNEQFMARSRT